MKRESPVWTEEQPFPTDIIYRFEDVLESLNPDFKLAKHLQEAFISLENLNNKVLLEMSQLNQVSNRFCLKNLRKMKLQTYLYCCQFGSQLPSFEPVLAGKNDIPQSKALGDVCKTSVK